ncbi:hypothetical protein D3C85_1658820 [compost metagenome]
MIRLSSMSTMAPERSNGLPSRMALISALAALNICTSHTTVATGPRNSRVTTSNSSQAPCVRIAQRLSAFDTELRSANSTSRSRLAV